MQLNLDTSEPTTSAGVFSASIHGQTHVATHDEISTESHVEIHDKIPVETPDESRNEHDNETQVKKITSDMRKLCSEGEFLFKVFVLTWF